MRVCVLTTHKLTTPLRKQSSTVRACVSCLHTIRLPIIFLLLRRPGGAIVMPVCVNHALQLHSKICVFYECVCVSLCVCDEQKQTTAKQELQANRVGQARRHVCTTRCRPDPEGGCWLAIVCSCSCMHSATNRTATALMFRP